MAGGQQPGHGKKSAGSRQPTQHLAEQSDVIAGRGIRRGVQTQALETGYEQKRGHTKEEADGDRIRGAGLTGQSRENPKEPTDQRQNRQGAPAAFAGDHQQPDFEQQQVGKKQGAALGGGGRQGRGEETTEQADDGDDITLPQGKRHGRRRGEGQKREADRGRDQLVEGGGGKEADEQRGDAGGRKAFGHIVAAFAQPFAGTQQGNAEKYTEHDPKAGPDPAAFERKFDQVGRGQSQSRGTNPDRQPGPKRFFQRTPGFAARRREGLLLRGLGWGLGLLLVLPGRLTDVGLRLETRRPGSGNHGVERRARSRRNRLGRRRRHPRLEISRSRHRHDGIGSDGGIGSGQGIRGGNSRLCIGNRHRSGLPGSRSGGRPSRLLTARPIPTHLRAQLPKLLLQPGEATKNRHDQHNGHHQDAQQHRTA